MNVRAWLCYRGERWYFVLPTGDTEYLLVRFFVIVANTDDQRQRFTANNSETELWLYKSLRRCIFKLFHKLTKIQSSNKEDSKYITEKVFSISMTLRKLKPKESPRNEQRTSKESQNWKTKGKLIHERCLLSTETKMVKLKAQSDAIFHTSDCQRYLQVVLCWQ